MSRNYTQLADKKTREYLEALADKKCSVDSYKDLLLKLGEKLGKALDSEIPKDFKDLYVACTVEDADFLAKGIIEKLQTSHKISFACFWNQRFSPFDLANLKVAPIIRRYKEKSSAPVKALVIIKSIISGACVVRTNLTDLIQDSMPEKIYVVAPVIYSESKEKLEAGFDKNISEKFEYIYFAEDDKRDEEGNVIPGIGGDIYVRLGFADSKSKNKYIPDIVKKRRIAA